jgi:hypothetical protein
MVPGRNVPLFDSSFGNLGQDIHGGKSEIHQDGGSHNTVYGDNAHFSWDQQPGGGVSGEHFVDTGYPKGNPQRHPFDH